MFAAATGLRPEEWIALERRDVDRRERILNVVRTVSAAEVVALGKTAASRRQVPLSHALARIMGTSVRLIELHYGVLLDGAGAGIADRLAALDQERGRAAESGE